MGNLPQDEPPQWASRVTLSRLALFWERAWPALWPALRIAGLFIVVALLDLLPQLPGWLHGAVLAIFAIALGGAVWRGILTLRIPDRAAAQRRLERINDLPHRPFDALDDAVATPGEASQQLWRLHRSRMKKLLKGLRFGWPAPGLIRSDPFATRIALATALVVLIFAAGADAPGSLARSVTPDTAFLAPKTPTTLDAWINPPGYTGRPPVFLTSGGGADAIAVPEGSILLAQVTGGGTPPHLMIEETRIDFDTLEANSYRVEYKLSAAATIRVMSRNRELDGWRIIVIPDSAPQVAFAEAPSASRQAALRLVYRASDDYGIATLSAVITRNPDDETDAALVFELPLPSINPRQVEGDEFRDLTPHPWAGLPVWIKLIARDAKGQAGISKTMAFTLPERSFLHPVARAIIAERKRLAKDPAENHATVARALGQIARQPAKYDHDIVVFMALDLSARRLDKEWRGDALARLQQLLWKTALRIEDGKISIAERTLRRAQKALREALARNAPDDELERLMAGLQTALDTYLDALAKEMEQRARNGEIGEIDPAANVLTRQDLQRMMDEIREMTRSGAREAAKRLLSELQRKLENMQAGIAQPRSGQASKMMTDLERVTKGQQDLLDRTFRQSRRERISRHARRHATKPGQGSDVSAGAVVQDALRRQLGDIMERFAEMTGDVPRAFGRAEQAMRGSAKALRRGSATRAVTPQTRALDELQQAMQSARNQLRQMMGQQPGGQGNAPMQGQQSGRDPFGRGLNEGGLGSGGSQVAIPDKSDLQRARAIRDELRARAAERNRPRKERDYIDRLLKQF
jgi:uncharacterized protein (TIGR02302 family)